MSDARALPWCPSSRTRRSVAAPARRSQIGRRGLLVGTTLLCAAAATPAAAANLVVTTTADKSDGACTPDDCSLREAFLRVAEGDVITVPAGRYVGSMLGTNGVWTVDQTGWTLKGAGAGLTIIDGGSLDRVFAFYARATLSGITVTGGGGRAGGCGCGGGIHVRQGGNLVLVDSVVEGNAVDNGGGGIDVDSTSRATLVNVVVRQNRSGGAGGGGIRVQPTSVSGGVLRMTNVTVSGNTAVSGADGGGLRNEGDVTGSNITISGNSSTAKGGGIANSAMGRIALDNATIANNGALGDGPGIHNSSAYAVSLRNSIVADTAGADCAGPSSPVVESLGHNMSLSASCGLIQPTDRASTDPLLGNLAVGAGNGMPVHTPLPASPVRDVGDNAACLATDQLGLSRPFGAACDVGAVEVRSPAPPPPPPPPPRGAGDSGTSTTTTGTGTVATTPLRNAPVLTELSRSTRINTRGRGTVRALCQSSPGDRCDVRLTVFAMVRGASSPRARQKVVVGTIRGSIPGGARGNLSVVLNAQGRGLLSAGLNATVAGTSSRIDMVASQTKSALKLRPATR